MKLSFGRMELTTGEPASMEPAENSPFRILILGDFSGRASRGVMEPIAGRKPLRIDRDNFDSLPSKLQAVLHLTLSGEVTVPIAFQEIDDFHPDRLYLRVESFEALRQLRNRLNNPATFKEASAQLQGWKTEPKPAVPPPPAAAPPPANPENLLEEMLGGTSRPAAELTPGAGDWNNFLRNAVGPHLVSTAELQSQAELVAMADKVISAQMRVILHHPRFQALESAWRGLQLLVRRLDSDGPLQLFVLDVSKAELAADLLATDDLSATSTYQQLVEKTIHVPGGQPWALLGSTFAFGACVDDVVLLGRLAQMASRAGGPFLAGAGSALAGCASFADSADPRDWKQELSAEVGEAWQALRALPEASLIGLFAPRLLLRLPYGKETDTIDSFPFDEMSGGKHESLLWGPPALAGACLLGRGFNRMGWSLRPETVVELEDLPLYAVDGDMQPIAEAWLTERGAEALADRGIMAFLSVQGSPSVRLHRWQSLAGKLQGRWNG